MAKLWAGRLSVRISDLVTAAACVVVGAFLLYESLKLDLFAPSGQTGPGFFPAALSVTLMLLGVLLSMVALRSRPDMPAQRQDYKVLYRPLVTLLLLAFSVIALDLVGFIAATVLLMAGLTIGLERRRLAGAITASIFVPVLMYYIFGTVLGVRLPTFLALVSHFSALD